MESDRRCVIINRHNTTVITERQVLKKKMTKELAGSNIIVIGNSKTNGLMYNQNRLLLHFYWNSDALTDEMVEPFGGK